MHTPRLGPVHLAEHHICPFGLAVRIDAHWAHDITGRSGPPAGRSGRSDSLIQARQMPGSTMME